MWYSYNDQIDDVPRCKVLPSAKNHLIYTKYCIVFDIDVCIWYRQNIVDIFVFVEGHQFHIWWLMSIDTLGAVSEINPSKIS